MKLAAEDYIGRMVLLGAFSSLASIKALSIFQTAAGPWTVETLFDLVSGLAGLSFQLLVIWLTLTRLPPKDAAAGWEPRVSAIAGTFMLLTLVALPQSDIASEWKAVAALVSLVGTVLSFYCLFWLGRSFAVMATARELVTVGPYGVVRHPLYASEMIILVGVMIANFSPAALVIGSLTVAFQFRRMVNEERVLRAVFPEYDNYATRVPFFFPRLLARAPA